MTDNNPITPKLLCEIGVCMSQGQARRMIHHLTTEQIMKQIAKRKKAFQKKRDRKES